ncbi:MarR family transcriptional regulator [Microtetraspora sp. NBRC 13810]|uniref:MarR family winged helix-turn-helix transcriptional regulator n=1 Tax=Microtetraspora sp. NBRC 13810 TaxID=3030990 RepID=UPI0024A4B827|nr:MarR family winged helix-turn-helix transcriptional regulator [Microtetraspora sp. NBRC 13810]GLW05901.1 MarR family transcriptional regulator [Microtetraspora sp. NBRC 13810]
MTGESSSEVLTSRLGYLLKHAYLRLTEASTQALAPFGIDGRELAVLAVLATQYPLSQLEAAGRLGIDRTTMVALLDTLETKGLVERHRSAQDRRRNTVQLTPTGQDCLRRAEQAREEMEQRFLAPLPPSDADRLIHALQTIVTTPKNPGL